MARSQKVRQYRPKLELLGDRVVPATLIDLTTHGSSGAANGALFRQFDAPADNGSINPFLALGGFGVEQAYNTDAANRFGDGNRNEIDSRAIRLGDVPLTVVDGVSYRVFFLDVRESSLAPRISLDELRLYVSQNQYLTGYNGFTKTLGGQAPVFDMDGAGDVFVRLDASLNAGGGQGDAFVYVPNSVFAGWQDSAFVNLFSRFGVNNPATLGRETWGLVAPPSPPPSGGTASLSGYVFLDQDVDGVFTEGEMGFASGGELWIRLIGTNDLGEAVDITVGTRDDGYYEFTGLRAGTYSIFQTVEPPYFMELLDGAAQTGSLGQQSVQHDFIAGDSSTWDAFLNISLATGQAGNGYHFAEVEGENT